jgi:hypothetical protein
MDLTDWRVWAILIASVLAFGLAILYPYQKQDVSILQEYQETQAGDVIDVIVETPDLETAKSILAMKYDGYTIVEQFYVKDKNVWIFRLQKEGEK